MKTKAPREWVTMVKWKGWAAKERLRARVKLAHVYPVKDLREHTFDEPCWCEPKTIKVKLPISIGTVVVHNSMDGRELVDMFGLQ